MMRWDYAYLLADASFPVADPIIVMEFLGGGEIKWRDSDSNPVLRVDQSRRICRDVILGLEYRSWLHPFLPLPPAIPLVRYGVL